MSRTNWQDLPEKKDHDHKPSFRNIDPVDLNDTVETKLVDRNRQKMALEYRMAGLSYREIADRMNYKHDRGAFDDVEEALSSIIKEPAKKVLDLELLRLDKMLDALWPSVKRGQVEAIDRVLKIMERRSKYLGIDASKEVNVHHEISSTAQMVAAQLGLEAADVIAEAERIVASIGGVD